MNKTDLIQQLKLVSIDNRDQYGYTYGLFRDTLVMLLEQTETTNPLCNKCRSPKSEHLLKHNVGLGNQQWECPPYFDALEQTKPVATRSVCSAPGGANGNIPSPPPWEQTVSVDQINNDGQYAGVNRSSAPIPAPPSQYNWAEVAKKCAEIGKDFVPYDAEPTETPFYHQLVIDPPPTNIDFFDIRLEPKIDLTEMINALQNELEHLSNDEYNKMCDGQTQVQFFADKEQLQAAIDILTEKNKQ